MVVGGSTFDGAGEILNIDRDGYGGVTGFARWDRPGGHDGCGRCMVHWYWHWTLATL